MRKLLIPMALVVASALGLSACGAKATVDQAVASVDASPDVQINVTASYHGPDTQATTILSDASFEVLVSNPTGAPISQAGQDVNSEVVVTLGGQTFADVREIDQNDYVEVDLDALSDAPGLDVPSSEVAAAQLLFGGRWFELPQSLLQSELPTSSAASAAVSKDQSIERAILKAVTGVIESTKYTTLANGGFSETGTLASIVKAIRPTLASITGATASTGAVKGDYTLTLTLSGSTATGASVSISAPVASGSSATIGLTATIAHASEPITVPSDATVITPSLLKELEAGAT